MRSRFCNTQLICFCNNFHSIHHEARNVVQGLSKFPVYQYHHAFSSFQVDLLASFCKYVHIEWTICHSRLWPRPWFFPLLVILFTFILVILLLYRFLQDSANWTDIAMACEVRWKYWKTKLDIYYVQKNSRLDCRRHLTLSML